MAGVMLPESSMGQVFMFLYGRTIGFHKCFSGALRRQEVVIFKADEF